MTHAHFQLQSLKTPSQPHAALCGLLHGLCCAALAGLLASCAQPPVAPAAAPVPPAPSTAAPAAAPARPAQERLTPAKPRQQSAPGASATPASAPASPPASAPTATPASAPLRIDSANSLIAVTVRRGGLLARLGHDHLIASRTVQGMVYPAQNRADFQFRLDQMTVDEAALRLAAGLEKQPDADAIAGTRNNMLSKVLDAERYPQVTIHAERGAAGQPLQVTITLHGVARTMTIPAQVGVAGGVMTVDGSVTLKQSDFGIVPFSLMGGALAVQDQLELRFHLTAR